MPVLTTPGVVAIVGAGKVPVAVSTAEIDSVKALIKSGLRILPWPSLSAGTKVLIERGPLTGVEGVVLKTEKRWRLLVSISLLQRAVSVELDRDWVRPINTHVLEEQTPSRLTSRAGIAAR